MSRLTGSVYQKFNRPTSPAGGYKLSPAQIDTIPEEISVQISYIIGCKTAAFFYLPLRKKADP